jgi:hypothetical protein
MRAVEEPIESASTRRGAIAPRLELPGRDSPTRRSLVLAALGTLALAGGAIYMFYRGRAAVLQPDAAPPPADVRTVAVMADATLAALDASVSDDAAPLVPTDAAPTVVRPRADASIEPASSDARPTTATATLMLGADPWGEIYIDGKPYGHTPKQIPVASGHHEVEIVFPAENPPRKQTFAIDLTTGETRSISADFK